MQNASAGYDLKKDLPGCANCQVEMEWISDSAQERLDSERPPYYPC